MVIFHCLLRYFSRFFLRHLEVCAATVQESDWFAPTISVKNASKHLLKKGRDDGTLLFSLLKQVKRTYKKTIVRVFVQILRHPLLHINIHVNTFLRA